MKTFYKHMFSLVALMFITATAQAGGDRDIGDGTLPLGITPSDASFSLNVREEAQGFVGFIAQDGVSLPLRQAIEHEGGQMTLLFGDAEKGIGLTGVLAPEGFTGQIFSSVNPSQTFAVKIAR